MEIDFVGAFELEYGWMVDFTRIISMSVTNVCDGTIAECVKIVLVRADTVRGLYPRRACNPTAEKTVAIVN